MFGFQHSDDFFALCCFMWLHWNRKPKASSVAAPASRCWQRVTRRFKENREISAERRTSERSKRPGGRAAWEPREEKHQQETDPGWDFKMICSHRKLQTSNLIIYLIIYLITPDVFRPSGLKNGFEFCWLNRADLQPGRLLSAAILALVWCGVQVFSPSLIKWFVTDPACQQQFFLWVVFVAAAHRFRFLLSMTVRHKFPPFCRYFRTQPAFPPTSSVSNSFSVCDKGRLSLTRRL